MELKPRHYRPTLPLPWLHGSGDGLRTMLLLQPPLCRGNRGPPGMHSERGLWGAALLR